ncbi:probable protein S-acyltransferase 23 [Carcharodon carcharias]|uniref:probable protein S-acyltransferase 23 n=1 Tax=Carcharodon carcharias TaxID=13397 RepID=UPI001B7EB55E|nr:probable protein S-acyltransferase 23 [Carcharodon carcharias]
MVAALSSELSLGSRQQGSRRGCKAQLVGGGQRLGHGHWQHIIPALVTGNLTELQTLVEKGDVELLCQYDEKGHTLLHWVALSGSISLLRYLLDLKLPANLPSRSESAQRPIHWAAVKGLISVIDVLLQAGVSVDERDKRGCTPLIIASQCGHIALCCYLMGKGARLQACDSEGDNALHWASFKGHCELTCLLIYSGFNPRQLDGFGQTPLHLAVLSGDLLTVQLLCEQNGVELETEDKSGNTPLKLARGHQFKDIVVYLENTISQSKSLIPKFNWSSLVFGPPGKSKGPILFFYGCLLLWGYPTYFTQIVSISFNRLLSFHITFLISNALMWYLFLKASLMDPGFLLRDSEEYDHALKQAVYSDEWKQGKNPLSRLCHTCHLVKPLRSKHCHVTNRCVGYFDHYCPYIYNDVGYRNRVYFLGFLATMCLNSVMGVYLAWDWFNEMGRSIFIGIGFIFLSSIAVSSAIMTCTYFYTATINITINEHMNQKRYSYLYDENGHFHNPFNRGIKLNLMEFFYLIEPRKEHELNTTNELCII